MVEQKPAMEYPDVNTGLNGCCAPSFVITSCVGGVHGRVVFLLPFTGRIRFSRNLEGVYDATEDAGGFKSSSCLDL